MTSANDFARGVRESNRKRAPDPVKGYGYRIKVTELRTYSMLTHLAGVSYLGDVRHTDFSRPKGMRAVVNAWINTLVRDLRQVRAERGT